MSERRVGAELVSIEDRMTIIGRGKVPRALFGRRVVAFEVVARSFGTWQRTDLLGKRSPIHKMPTKGPIKEKNGFHSN